MNKEAQFITFEGGDGAGKTTQIKMFSDWLAGKYGLDIVLTREPGGTKEAEKIRKLLVQKDGGDWDPLSEVLLLSAARREHLVKKIWPALEAGKWVISDRFVDSTFAFQGYGMGLGPDYIHKLYKRIAGNFMPSITFILDIDPKEGLRRSGKQLSETIDNTEKKEDRYELMGLKFQEKLKKGFLDIAKRNPKRCRVIDASQDIETVHKQICDIFENSFCKYCGLEKAS